MACVFTAVRLHSFEPFIKLSEREGRKHFDSLRKVKKSKMQLRQTKDQLPDRDHPLASFSQSSFILQMITIDHQHDEQREGYRQ